MIENIGQYISGNPLLAFAAVFLGGLISASSPCVLAIMPLVIGYVGGESAGDRKKALGYSLLFALGLSLTFTILGAIAAILGQLFGDIGKWWYWVVGLIAITMGLSMIGVFNISFPFADKLMTARKGYVGAFLLGLLFGVVSSPCATPVLVVILSFVAAQQQLVYGVSLLFVYAIGHCALIVLAGVATGFVTALISTGRVEKYSRIVKQVSGGLIILAGFWIIWMGIR